MKNYQPNYLSMLLLMFVCIASCSNETTSGPGFEIGGTPAESVCGAYLLLRTKVNADGSRSLCSIDQPEQEIVADTVKEPSPAAQLFL